ncbi:DMT family transporter [Anaeroselena agilis]|uniref:DMT family transporter n=1 Tax=Anaeroselena agilis TaxID=3063788 RepID=A0ABU3NV99_9FIRM|nr:DMT family transporter [Selenomonadales bacterium 4137-cl]
MVATLWGVNVIMIKYLTKFFPPLALAPIRLTLAVLLLFPVVMYRHGYHRLSREAWLMAGGSAVFTIFLHQTTMSWGVSVTSGTHAALILGLSPLFVALLASRLLHEPFTWQKVLGIVLGFGGVVLVVGGDTRGTASLAGDMVMFGSMLAFVTGTLFIKRGTALVSPLLVTAYSMLMGSGLLIVLGLFVNDAWYYEGAFAPAPVAVLLFSSFVNTALGAVWWNMGIKQAGASTTTLFQNGIPVVGVFTAALWLGEDLQWNHLVALVLVLAGVSLGTGVVSLSRAEEKG